MNDSSKPAHFKGKDALSHVAEAQAEGIIASTEVHGTEIPGYIAAGTDAAKETALIMLILWLFFINFEHTASQTLPILALFAFGWIFWKGGRSGWLGWSRLERMHRVVEQERWEIQHHRKQERDELKELYAAKGLEGKLLEDVMDVLMADEDRLLKIMVEEELCLSLETHEHPLRQSLGALIGTATSAGFVILCSLIPEYGIWIGSLSIITLASWVSATYEGNKRIPAICWNLGITALTVAPIISLIEYINA